MLAGQTPVLVHNSGGCIPMSSAIGQDSLLTKAAQQAGKNQDMQRDLDHLFEQLPRENMNPGRGSKALTGTDCAKKLARSADCVTAVCRIERGISTEAVREPIPIPSRSASDGRL